MKTLQKTSDVSITPAELAALFCSMDNHEMADFLNWSAHLLSEEEYPFEFHMEAVSSCGRLTPEGRSMMKTIGEYSEALELPAEPEKKIIHEAAGWTRETVVQMIMESGEPSDIDGVMLDLSKIEGSASQEEVQKLIVSNSPF